MPHALHTTTVQAALTLPLLLEVEFALTVPTLVPHVTVLEPAQPASVDSTSSKDNAKPPVLLVLALLTASVLATLELSQMELALPAANLASLLSMETVSHVILTVLNVREMSTDAQDAWLDLRSIHQANDVYPLLNAHMVKNSLMEHAKISAIMDSCSMKEFAFSEDALLDMLITVLEVVLEAHLLLGQQAHQLPALLDNSS